MSKIDYKPYRERLKDPRWKQKRKEILERDGYTCSECGAQPKSLDVHHRYYTAWRDPWEYPDWALVTLCRKCHECEQDRARDGFQEWEHAIGYACLTTEHLREIHDALDNLRCNAKLTQDALRKAFVNSLNRKARS